MAHFQVYASEQAYIDGLDFVDTIDTEVPMSQAALVHAYNEAKKLPDFDGATDLL